MHDDHEDNTIAMTITITKEMTTTTAMATATTLTMTTTTTTNHDNRIHKDNNIENLQKYFIINLLLATSPFQFRFANIVVGIKAVVDDAKAVIDCYVVGGKMIRQ